MKLGIESLAEEAAGWYGVGSAVPSEQQEATWSSLSAVAVLAQEFAGPELALTDAFVVVDVARV
jgi:hypothetical protein